jgi:predicted nucleic acid-binding protein
VTRWLIDTGPLVAYVDAGDPAHAIVAESLDRFTGQLLTTAAVVTEAMHFVADALEGPETLIEFLVATGTRIEETMRPAHLQAAAVAMAKYRDTPMDFADATLVLLADAVKVTDVLTLDRRGFTTYRTPEGKAFRLVLPARR